MPGNYGEIIKNLLIETCSRIDATSLGGVTNMHLRSRYSCRIGEQPCTASFNTIAAYIALPLASLDLIFSFLKKYPWIKNNIIDYWSNFNDIAGMDGFFFNELLHITDEIKKFLDNQHKDEGVSDTGGIIVVSASVALAILSNPRSRLWLRKAIGKYRGWQDGDLEQGYNTRGACWKAIDFLAEYLRGFAIGRGLCLSVEALISTDKIMEQSYIRWRLGLPAVLAIVPAVISCYQSPHMRNIEDNPRLGARGKMLVQTVNWSQRGLASFFFTNLFRLLLEGSAEKHQTPLITWASTLMLLTTLMVCCSEIAEQEVLQLEVLQPDEGGGNAGEYKQLSDEEEKIEEEESNEDKTFYAIEVAASSGLIEDEREIKVTLEESSENKFLHAIEVTSGISPIGSPKPRENRAGSLSQSPQSFFFSPSSLASSPPATASISSLSSSLLSESSSARFHSLQTNNAFNECKKNDPSSVLYKRQ
jgi:hypothetical protein